MHYNNCYCVHYTVKEYSQQNNFSPNFVPQNAARIVRALFEIALRKRWPAMTYRLLNLSKVIDKRLWGWVSPLRQFSVLPPPVLTKLEQKNLTVDKLKDMRKDEIGKEGKAKINSSEVFAHCSVLVLLLLYLDPVLSQSLGGL